MKKAQAQDLMTVARANVKLIRTINTIFILIKASRSSLNIVNMQFLLVCRQGKDAEFNNINDEYFNLNLINSLKILAGIMNI